MKRVFLTIFSIILILFTLTSCKDDNIKKYYDNINEHNGCLITVGKKYDITRLNNYNDFEEYNGEIYDYLCFALNYEDKNNYTKTDIDTLYSFSSRYEKYAIILFFDFKEFDMLEGIYTENDFDNYISNDMNLFYIAFENSKCVDSGQSGSNDTNFISNIIFQFSLLIGENF